ncbi:hypothetical protein GCM10025867_32440 [Frondihabitans sucicola]|uniref:Tetratricopeptide repeat protein n=1 Tax=Frondihabitans sucicola TaxID=1268041 RepID=A0ABM8GRB6_9MICO|nr:hypothetical protein [Frondihabitans sucicola]BDZ51003.1 hypothetical protein GCM10025867_32440 [Frondihabitans sucicola]
MSTLLQPPLAPPPPPIDPEAGVPTSPPVPPEIVEYRRKLRRRMFAWSLLPVVIVILVALKLLSMPTFAALSQATYGAKQYDRSVAMSDGLGVVNVFEPWVRHFDRGAGLAQIGVLVDARNELESALSLVPASHTDASCMVRTDLALVVEQQGDSAVLDGTFDKASAFYKHALALIAAAPAGCFDTPNSTDDPPTKKPLDDAKSRLEQKQQQAEQQAGGSQGQGGTDQGGQGSSGGDGSSDGSGQSNGGQNGGGSSGDGSSGQGGSSSQDPLDKLQQKDGDAQKQQQQNNDRNRYFGQNPEQYDGKPW